MGHPAFGEKVKISSTSAAIIPSQWGGDKGKLRPYLKQISGKTGEEQLFDNIAEVIGGKPPKKYKELGVRDALRKLYPGKLIIELPGAKKDLGTVDIEITIPSKLPCPEGTKEVK